MENPFNIFFKKWYCEYQTTGKYQLAQFCQCHEGDAVTFLSSSKIINFNAIFEINEND